MWKVVAWPGLEPRVLSWPCEHYHWATMPRGHCTNNFSPSTYHGYMYNCKDYIICNKLVSRHITSYISICVKKVNVHFINYDYRVWVEERRTTHTWSCHGTWPPYCQYTRGPRQNMRLTGVSKVWWNLW